MDSNNVCKIILTFHWKTSKLLQALAKVSGREKVIRKKSSNGAAIIKIAQKAGGSYYTMSRVVNNKSYNQYQPLLYTSNQRKTKVSTYVNMTAQGLADGLLIVLPCAPKAWVASLRQQHFPSVLTNQAGFFARFCKRLQSSIRTITVAYNITKLQKHSCFLNRRCY